jgi:hypothetical protein
MAGEMFFHKGAARMRFRYLLIFVARSVASELWRRGELNLQAAHSKRPFLAGIQIVYKVQTTPPLSGVYARRAAVRQTLINSGPQTTMLLHVGHLRVASSVTGPVKCLAYLHSFALPARRTLLFGVLKLFEGVVRPFSDCL